MTDALNTARHRRVALLLAALAAAVAMTFAIGQGSAGAALGDGAEINEFEAYPTNTQAGGHPDVVVRYSVDTRTDPPLDHPCKCNEAKDIIIDVPAGVIGNPHAYPQCRALDFAISDCPVDAQIGAVLPDTGGDALTSAIFNLTPNPDQAGLVGFKTPIFDTPVYIELSARTGSDYGLRSNTRNIQRLITIPNLTLTFWGVPADEKYDHPPLSEFPPGYPDDDFDNTFPQLVRPDGSVIGRFFAGYIGLWSPVGESSNWPLRPFMQNPTTCGVPLESTMTVIAYDGGVTKKTAPWPATTGCGQLSFNPSLAADPTTTQADSPSGVDIVITVPQFQSPTVPSPSQIEEATLTLPPGFSINPNAAAGKMSCTDVQARFGTELQAQCPEYAKVGSLEIHSAVLPDVLPGALYLGEPLPGNRYRLFLVADGFGVHVKLPGTVTLDPQTGQITTSFDNLPQTPFEEFNLHVFGAERGILATPTKCGRYQVDTTFGPWNAELPQQTAAQFFEITSGPGGSPCPGNSRPFTPTFNAASADNTAGAHSTFAVAVSRSDGEQFLDGLNVATPRGFSGILKGIPYCPEAAIATVSNPLYSGLAETAASSCPAASQVGTTVAGAGAGSRPLYQGGKVYLAGPYKGAPLSLVVVIPAVSGPYDLGNVAVRVQVLVDPETARVSTISDPLPRIIEGIPLRGRLVQVNIDRPNFAINPTNCSRLSTDATVFGDEGGVAQFSRHYQASNCGILDFQPRLAIDLVGSTKRRAHPALHATLRATAGNANISRAQVKMPKDLLLDQSHIGTVCTRPQVAADACPAGSRYGTATAVTPLLDEPLTGNVYLVSSSNELPDLLVMLKGQVDFNLRAKVDSVKGAIRTTFGSVPDVPVSSFTLKMLGGDKGLLINSVAVCKLRGANIRATVKFRGQNGKALNPRPKLGSGCGKKERRKKQKRHARSNGKGA